MCFRLLAGHISSDVDSSASSLFDSDSDVNAPHLSALETLNQLPGSESDLQAGREAPHMRHDADAGSGSDGSSCSRSSGYSVALRLGLHTSDSDRRVRRRHANSPGPASEAGAAGRSADHRGRDAVFRLPNYSHILEKGHTSHFTLKGIWYCISCKQSTFCGLNVLLQVWGCIR